MCSKKGEKVSTPLDKDGRDLRGLITHMRQLSPTSGQPYFLIFKSPEMQPIILMEWLPNIRIAFTKLII